MHYVHVAEAQPRQLPAHVQKASRRIADPDKRVLAMLGARGVVPEPKPSSSASATARKPMRRRKGVAKTAGHDLELVEAS